MRSRKYKLILQHKHTVMHNKQMVCILLITTHEEYAHHGGWGGWPSHKF